MSSGKKDFKHLRLVSFEPDVRRIPTPDSSLTTTAHLSTRDHLRVVDEAFITDALYHHGAQERTRRWTSRWRLIRASLLATAVAAVVVPLASRRALHRSGDVLAADSRVARDPARLPMIGPSLHLVPTQPVSPQMAAWAFTLAIHNLPGALAPAASHLAVAIVDGQLPVTWLAPADQAPATAWPIPAVATFALPDGPHISMPRPGTRIVALFLRNDAASQHLEAWAQKGATETDALSGPLGAATLRTQTLYF